MNTVDAEVRLDRLTPDDIPSALVLSQTLGWPHRLDDWRMMLSLGSGFAARDDGGALIGSAVAWTWEKRVATAGLIIVRNDRQGRGIGQRLLDRLLDTSKVGAVRLFSTAEGRKLYERRGFVTTGLIHQFQGHVAACPPTHGDVRRANAADRGAILALDTAAFGTSRERLIDVLLGSGEACVVGRGTAPAGFAFRRHFGRGNLIGPVVAPDIMAALALIASLVTPGFNRIDLTEAAAPIVPHLAALGFEPAGTVEEMTAGDWPTRRSMTSFALAAQSFG